MTSKETWCQYINTGRPVELRNRIVEENLHLVRVCVGSYMKKLPPRAVVTGDELWSRGSEGLIRAVETYDPNKNNGARFETYADRWIKPKLRECWRDDHERLGRVQAKKLKDEGRSSNEIVANFTEFGCDFKNSMASSQPGPCQVAYDQEIASLLDNLECLKGIRKRNLAILKRYVFHGWTMLEIGRKYRLAESSISLIISGLVATLRADKGILNLAEQANLDTSHVNSWRQPRRILIKDDSGNVVLDFPSANKAHKHFNLPLHWFNDLPQRKGRQMRVTDRLTAYCEN
jgi:RNA polymerase sigma factor (sigma-70 family)